MPMGEYADFDDCIAKNKDKDDPQAFCGAIKAKVEGERTKVPIKLSWNSPIQLRERFDKGYSITGTAISETVSRNNVLYSAEELSASAITLEGKPIMKDHSESVDSIVGKVSRAWYDPQEKVVKYKGTVFDEKVREMIDGGYLNWVSIGASMREVVEEELDDGRKVVRPKGIEFLELSFVPIPGDPNTSVAKSLSEAYSLWREDVNKTDSVMALRKEVAEKLLEMEERLKLKPPIEEKANKQEKKVGAEVDTVSEELVSEVKKLAEKIEAQAKEISELKAVKEKAEAELKQVSKAAVIQETVETTDDNFIVERSREGTSFYRMPDFKGRYLKN